MKTSQRRRRTRAARSSDDLEPGRNAPGHTPPPLATALAQTPRMAAQRRANHAAFGPVATQRRIAAWGNAVCASGTVVYHNTGQDAAVSLVTDGVQQVQNAWGGGILGTGFYTHTTRAGAEVYGNARFTIAFTVGANLQGQVVPRGVIGRGIDAQNYGNENYLDGNAFLTNEDDRNEYKFHRGDNLVFTNVCDNNTGITYNDAASFINAILQ